MIPVHDSRSMYFAVVSMSAAERRRQFFAPVIEQLERTLAVP